MPPEDVRAILARLGVRPSRSRGQHLLIDPRVAVRQLSYADLRASDVVLELGPGLGVLTRALVERAKRVIAIESDGRFAAHLRRRCPRLRSSTRTPSALNGLRSTSWSQTSLIRSPRH